MAQTQDASVIYSDIINMEHHVSSSHPHMALIDRAAQFAPFAALTGFGEVITRAADMDEEAIEFSDDEKLVIDARLRVVKSLLSQRPYISIRYYSPAASGETAKYSNHSGHVIFVDDTFGYITFADGQKVKINDIISVAGDIFETASEYVDYVEEY